MNVARLNFSHGTYQEHAEKIALLRKLIPEIAILADLQGPRIRTGLLQKKEITLFAGKAIILTGKTIIGDERRISISPAETFSGIQVDDIILVAEGTIKLKVVRKKAKAIECRILMGGKLGEHKGVNLPQTRMILPSLTAKDKKDIEWARKQGVDYFALSFVRQASDVLALKKILARKKSNIPVIAKIEKAEAVQNLREIIEVSDGVMVARGDLGVEMNLEKVPVIQKEIIELCRGLEKPVIVATQMLESMVKEASPTRAEVSDVANAIFDGTDAVMLSEETSIGDYPVEAIRTMDGIAREIEKIIKFTSREIHNHKSTNIAVAHAACVLANTVDAKAIITFTETGSTALRVSKHRPEIPIFGIATDTRILRRLALYFGVQPRKIKPFRYIDEMVLETEAAIVKTGHLKRDDLVVITAGVPINIPGTTNFIKVHQVGKKQAI